MKKLILSVLMILNCLHHVSAQSVSSLRLEAEIDPIAYAMNGYSFHAIIVASRFRADAGIFGIRQPTGYSGNAGFSTFTSGYGIKINYLLNKKETWFAGLGMGYAQNHIEHIESSTTAYQQVFSIGVHAGYRWFMFQNKDLLLNRIYLVPWFSIDYNHVSKDIEMNGDRYEQKKISLFPTVHIGYKF